MTRSEGLPNGGHYPVWDLAVRLIHWFLPVAIAVMWWSGQQGRMDIHEKIGYAVLCLAITRIIWGFIGSEGARFRSFVRGPQTVLRYLANGGQYAGHNPLGALSVMLLLGLLCSQGASGMFSRDDLLFEGPFAYWVGDLSGTMTEWHKTNWLFLQGFVALHLVSVFWHQWRKKQPLVQAMWFGKAGHKSATTAPKPLWQALMVALLLGAGLWGLISVAPVAPSYY
ncbi:MAG: cytochrome b/b6 domain-containing protein [Luminiphilus sp.]|nr:cytochrome b/b6 domain-containing protein [Luminiphilus sp.]